MKQVTPYNTEAGKKKEVEEMFDNIAPKYDLLNHVLSMKIDVLWRNTLVKWMNADQPKEVLDVATGTGDLAIAVQKGTGAKVIGFLGPFYMFYFKNILPQIGRLISKDNRAYTYLPDSVNAFPFGEKMKNILLEVGFKTVEYKKLSLGIATIYKATK